jgi:uncharacterized membrane protein
VRLCWSDYEYEIRILSRFENYLLNLFDFSLGRVKRQQSQTQSQKGQGGSQIQSQTQDGPGGQQHQTQSQGQNVEPVATPAAVHPVNDHGSQPSQVPPQGNDQQYAPQYEQGQSENRQGSYPQQPQANYQPGFAPFGFGAFGPAGLKMNFDLMAWI